MKFSDKLKFVRGRLNLSQEELAQNLRVSFATVNRWEQDKYNPSRLALRAFDEFCVSKCIFFVDGEL